MGDKSYIGVTDLPGLSIQPVSCINKRIRSIAKGVYLTESKLKIELKCPAAFPDSVKSTGYCVFFPSLVITIAVGVASVS